MNSGRLLGVGLLIAAFVGGALTHRVGVFQRAHAVLAPAPDALRPTDNALLAARREIEDAFPPKGAVAFVGDSITEMMNWSAAFPDVSVANFGISTDTTSGVLARLPTIERSGAKLVVLWIGLNDIFRGDPPSEAAARFGQIIAELHRAGIPIVALSAATGDEDHKGGVRQFNKAAAASCETPSCTWVDLSALQSNGLLRPELTFDRVHLTAAGYREVVGILSPFLQATK